jgi:hypothetical protein
MLSKLKAPYVTPAVVSLSVFCMFPGFRSVSATELRAPISLSGGCTVRQNCGRGVLIIKQGSRLPVSLLNELDTAKYKTGSSVKAMLISPLKFGTSTIAEPGSTFEGWVASTRQSRNAIAAKLPSHQWLNTNGLLSLHFNRLITTDGRLIAVDASPAPNTVLQCTEFDTTEKQDRKQKRRDNRNSGSQRNAIIVNEQGQISYCFSKMKYAATGIAIEGLGLAAGPYKLVAGPAISATAGAVNPSYAFDHPVDHPHSSERLKGFFLGMVKGAPGGFLLTGFANHGLEMRVPVGAQLEIELQSDLVIPTK